LSRSPTVVHDGEVGIESCVGAARGEGTLGGRGLQVGVLGRNREGFGRGRGREPRRRSGRGEPGVCDVHVGVDGECEGGDGDAAGGGGGGRGGDGGMWWRGGGGRMKRGGGRGRGCAARWVLFCRGRF